MALLALIVVGSAFAWKRHRKGRYARLGVVDDGAWPEPSLRVPTSLSLMLCWQTTRLVGIHPRSRRRNSCSRPSFVLRRKSRILRLNSIPQVRTSCPWCLRRPPSVILCRAVHGGADECADVLACASTGLVAVPDGFDALDALEPPQGRQLRHRQDRETRRRRHPRRARLRFAR